MKLIFYFIGIIALMIITTKATEEEEILSNDEEDGPVGKPIGSDDENDMSAAAASAPSLCSINLPALTKLIQNVVEAKYASQPIVKLFQIVPDGRYNLLLNEVSGGNLKLGKQLDKIALKNGASSVTSSYLAYRPSYRDYHQTKLGAIFVNLERLFPCIKNDKGLQALCKRVTYEEDGFSKGRTIVEGSDIGNNFRIFSTKSNIQTYGQVFSGCPILNGANGCLPKYYHQVIACYLPRSCK